MYCVRAAFAALSAHGDDRHFGRRRGCIVALEPFQGRFVMWKRGEACWDVASPIKKN